MATAKKKPVAKKATAKKPTAKKAPAKKPAPKKATNAKAKPKTTSAKSAITTRRPDANLPPTVDTIDGMTNTILNIIQALDYYAANLRALDRQRHNCQKAFGFLARSLRIAQTPHIVETSDMALNKAPRQAVRMTNAA
jgi:hypothetical protein